MDFDLKARELWVDRDFTGEHACYGGPHKYDPVGRIGRIAEALRAAYSAGLSEREKLEAVVEAAKKMRERFPVGRESWLGSEIALEAALAALEAAKEEGK